MSLQSRSTSMFEPTHKASGSATEDDDEIGEQPFGKPHVLHLTHMGPGGQIALPRTAIVLDQWRNKSTGGVLVLWQVEADDADGND